MFEKKTKCRVCGYRFTPTKEAIYTVEEPITALEALTKAPPRFSAIDCPRCGCQIPLAIRTPRVDLTDIAKKDGKNQKTTQGRDIPALPYPDGDISILACPNCGSGEYLHNADENENEFCGKCGQAIKWAVADK